MEGIEFQAPRWLELLWGLPLVVVFYLFRKRARRLLVPFLPFWERVFAHRRRRLSFVRTLVSIVLQMLAAAAIIVALAQPYREESRHVEIATIVVVDRTFATSIDDGGAPAHERTLERARAVAQRAAAEGPIALAWLRGGVEPFARVPDESGVAAAFAAPPPPPSGTRAPGAVAGLASAVLEGARVVFVTPFKTDGTLPGVTVVGSARGPLENGGIRAVALDPDSSALAVVTDGGGKERELSLVAPDGAVHAVARVPAGVFSARLQVTDGVPADSMLRLDPPDAFPGDDVAALVLPERARLRVLVASDAATPALDAALLASGVMDQARSGRVPLARLGEVASGFDVVVVVRHDPSAPLPPGRFVVMGGGAAQVPMAPGTGGGEARATRKNDGVAWLSALDPDEWRIHDMPALQALPGLEVLVEGTRGPLVARFERGGVTGVLVTPAPTLAASTLPLLPAFPLMLRGALLELAPRRPALGAVVHQVEARIVAAEAEARACVREDGASAPLLLARDGAGYVLPSEPGRFQVGGVPVATAWLSHEGLPKAAMTAEDPWPAPPRAARRVSFLAHVLIFLICVLFVEWCSYHLGFTD